MEAHKAMLKEFSQINEKEVFSPIKASSLTPTQRRKALRTINLIKEKKHLRRWPTSEGIHRKGGRVVTDNVS